VSESGNIVESWFASSCSSPIATHCTPHVSKDIPCLFIMHRNSTGDLAAQQLLDPAALGSMHQQQPTGWRFGTSVPGGNNNGIGLNGNGHGFYTPQQQPSSWKFASGSNSGFPQPSSSGFNPGWMQGMPQSQQGMGFTPPWSQQPGLNNEIDIGPNNRRVSGLMSDNNPSRSWGMAGPPYSAEAGAAYFMWTHENR
jgi:hypothetical protein